MASYDHPARPKIKAARTPVRSFPAIWGVSFAVLLQQLWKPSGEEIRMPSFTMEQEGLPWMISDPMQHRPETGFYGFSVFLHRS